jgi:hypothetical protein
MYFYFLPVVYCPSRHSLETTVTVLDIEVAVDRVDPDDRPEVAVPIAALVTTT